MFISLSDMFLLIKKPKNGIAQFLDNAGKKHHQIETKRHGGRQEQLGVKPIFD